MRKFCYSTLLFLAIVFLAERIAFGQLWSGVLNTNRAIDWSSAGATIVNRTTQCGSTISAYGSVGTPLSASTISTAVASCTSGDFVQLGSGTFYLSDSLTISTSNVTLRGMGPDQTFLVFEGYSTSPNCQGFGPATVCIFNGNHNSFTGSSENTANWTAGYSSGAASITLSSTTNLQIGSNLTLVQQDDASDTGDFWVCQTFGTDGDCTQQGTTGNAKVGWGQTQNVQVQNISGSTVTITPGLYAPQWTSGKTPAAFWTTQLPITGFGIENLTIDFSAGLSGQWAGLDFSHATNCWAKNIRSINNTSSGSSSVTHMSLFEANHVTIRDSYFYGANPASSGYGVFPSQGSADNLIENNIFQHMPAGLVFAGGVGTIAGYNYAVDDYYTTSTHWQINDEQHHNLLDYYNLYEGNEGIGAISDNIHGTSFAATYFRDYWSGLDPNTQDSENKTLATNAYIEMAANRYNNVVGSVMGTSTYHTHYITYPATTTTCGTASVSYLSVFVVGWSDQAGIAFTPSSGHAFNCASNIGSFSIYDDPSIYDGTSAGNLMLWGNYAACTGDAACNAVRWEATENASSAATYPGLASPSQTLPNSFYHSSQPAWWPIAITWPAVGPDVTGGTAIPNVGGHVYLTPSANCYLNVMGGSTDGSTGLLTYNANACYSGIPTRVHHSAKVE